MNALGMALVFTSTTVIPEGEVIPEESRRGIELLGDAMISTFAWEKLVEEPVVLDALRTDETSARPQASTPTGASGDGDVAS